MHKDPRSTDYGRHIIGFVRYFGIGSGFVEIYTSVDIVVCSIGGRSERSIGKFYNETNNERGRLQENVC